MAAGFCAGQPRDAVGVQAGAVDQLPRGEVAGGGDDGHAVGVVPHRRDAGAEDDLAAGLADPLGQPLAHLPVVDDAGLGDVDRLDAGGVRLQLRQPGLVDQRAVDAVGLPALVDPLQRRQFGVGRRRR